MKNYLNKYIRQLLNSNSDSFILRSAGSAQNKYRIGHATFCSYKIFVKEFILQLIWIFNAACSYTENKISL